MLKTFILKNSYQSLLVIAFLLLLLIYYISMPKTVALEDDGYFILSAYFNGVSHPPGYPLHSLLGHFMTYISFGSVAVKVHLLSAIFGAAASVVAGLIILYLFNNVAISVLTTFIVGTGQGFWSQSIISEVYTLNVFFVLLLILISLKINILASKVWDEEGTKKINKYIFYLFLILGLGLTNHWPLFVLGGAGCSIVVFPLFKRKGITWRMPVLGFLLGVTPVIWLIINSNLNPFINFSGALSNFSEVYDFISRKYYSKGIDFSTDAGLIDKVYFVLYSLKIVTLEHSYFGMLFLFVGIYASFKRMIKINVILLFLSFFITPIALPFLLNYSFTNWYKMIYMPYLLVSYALSGIFISAGVYLVTKHFKKQYFVLAAFSLLIIVPGVYVGERNNYRNDYSYSTDYSLLLLNSLDRNAVIFVNGDVETGTLSFARYVLKVRPDITIIHNNGLFLSTRIFDPRYISKDEKNKKIINYVMNSSRPVYFTYPQKGVGLENHWLYYKFNKDVKVDSQVLMRTDKFNDLLLKVHSDTKDLDDPWTKIFNERLKYSSIPTLFYYLVSSNNPDLKLAYKDIVVSLFYDFSNYIYALRFIEDFSLYDVFGGYSNITLVGDNLLNYETDKKRRAAYFNLKAEHAESSAKYTDSLKLYLQSIKEWKDSSNVATNKVQLLCTEKIPAADISLCNNI